MEKNFLEKTYSYEENTIAVDPEHMDDYHRADAFDRQQVIDKSLWLDESVSTEKELLERIKNIVVHV